MKRLLVVSVAIAGMCMLMAGLSGCSKKETPTPPSQADVEAAKAAVAATPEASETVPATAATPAAAPVIPPEAAAQAEAAQAAMKEAAAKGLVPPNVQVPPAPPAPENK